MTSQVDKVVQVFKTLTQNPAVSSGRILNVEGNSLMIYSIWSQRNLERGKNIKFQQSYIVDTTARSVRSLLPVDVSSELMSSVSKSNQFRAVIREIPQQDSNPKKQLLEIWKWSQLYKTFELSALDIHGDVYTDDEFGCLDWSPCEQKLIYIAEKKVPKSEPFHKIKPVDNGNTSGNKKPTKGEEYVYRQDWGEALVGKHCPVAVVCDIATEQVAVLSGIPEHFSVGQVTWAPEGGVVGIAWENIPRRLGFIYCTNRKSYVFHLTTNGEYSILSGDGLAVRSPRFSPDNNYLLWMERLAGGPHHGAHSLIKYIWKSKQKVTVIDRTVETTTCINGDVLYGLYNQSLPRRCFIDSNKLLLSTPHKYVVNLYLVDVDKCSVKKLNESKGSIIVLDVHMDRVLCVQSSLQKPGALVVGKLSEEEEVDWVPVTHPQIPMGLENFDVVYLDLQSETGDTCTNFNAIYFGPKPGVENKVPLIVWPHGGPHACFTDAYSLYSAFFALLGFAVVQVNYRGSIGQGQSSVEFLCGRVGDTDVKDVHQTTKAVCKQFSYIDPDRIVLFGGSHGGFLVTHLSGQFPDCYKAVVARNPVIDIGSLFFVSDIPDWSAVEAGYTYGFTGELDLNTEQWKKMRESSPLHYANQVKAPTLLLIGKKDLRVPSSQGILYFHTLKALDIKTKLLLYEDNHPLSQVPVEIDATVNSALWFLDCLETK